MKDWQFLIQKQGERSWNPLESPNLEILAGKYRLVARSNLANTDVEVRVTHSSKLEIPPKQRVQKRTCRTNAEGLMAVIPFTYFKPGIWEIQCSGDLMSDILGQSWQFRVELQVLPQETGTTVENSLSPEVSANNNSSAISRKVDAQTQSGNPERTHIAAKIHNAVNHAKKSLIAPDSVLVSGSAKQVGVKSGEGSLVSSTDSNKYSATEDTIVENHDDTLDAEVVSVDSELIRENQNYLENEEVSEKRDSSSNTEIENTFSDDDSVSTELSIVPQTSLALAESELETEGYTIIDAPVSPVWLKSNSVEQILQNLIDLALPSEDYLLTSESPINTSAELTPALPLRFKLVKENYVTRWGEYLTVEGSVELQETANLNWGEGSDLESISAGELEIELRSPLTGEILHQVKQFLPEKLLPFDIACSIQIPPECESKLILASISLSGALAGIGEAEILATQPFTITANITELLAVANFTQSEATHSEATQSREIESVEIPALQPVASDEEKTSNSGHGNLDLELLNLVNSTKSSNLQFTSNSVSTNAPHSRKSAPKSISYRVSQEPRIANSPRSSEDCLDNTKATSTTFPFLRRLPASIDEKEDANEDFDAADFDGDDLLLDNFGRENLDASLHNPSLQVKETEIDGENLPLTVSKVDNLVDEPQLEVTPHEEESSNFSPEKTLDEALPDSTETISEYGDLYTSPLIRKWMENHGYTPPEGVGRLYQAQETHSFSQIEAELRVFECDNIQASVNADTSPEETASTDSATTSEDELASSQSYDVRSEETAPTDSATASEGELASSHSYDAQSQSSHQTLQLVSYSQSKVESALLAKEIVVDDIYPVEAEINADNYNPETSNPETSQSHPLLKPSRRSGISLGEISFIEALPTPKLQIPQGELISGSSIRVRVLLPEVEEHLAVKLWLEDCQTRSLLSGPHLITNLLPNSKRELEAMTFLHIPFGCLKIRIEAIAIDLLTKQESHKFSTLRQVVPPNLPTVQLDELTQI